MITNSALYQSCKCLSFLKRHMSGLVLNLVSQNKNEVELTHCTYLIKKCAYMVRLGFEVHCRQITSINAINFVGTTIYYFHITYNTPPLPTHPRKSRTIDLIYDSCHLCPRNRIDGIVCPMRNHVTLFLSRQSEVCYGE